MCLKIGIHASATHLKAPVVALRATSDGGSGGRTSQMAVSYGESPVVAYMLPGKNKPQENDDVGFFDGPYNVGDSVEIFYYPWTKEDAKLYNFKNYWLNISTVMILIVAFLAWTGINNIINMKDDEEIKIPIDPIP